MRVVDSRDFRHLGAVTSTIALFPLCCLRSCRWPVCYGFPASRHCIGGGAETIHASLHFFDPPQSLFLCLVVLCECAGLYRLFYASSGTCYRHLSRNRSPVELQCRFCYSSAWCYFWLGLVAVMQDGGCVEFDIPVALLQRVSRFSEVTNVAERTDGITFFFSYFILILFMFLLCMHISIVEE